MGFAAPADDELADTITVGEYLLRDKDASYLLTVDTDAFTGDGLLRGDMVIFERSANYKVGELVVVLNEDGYSLKYFRKQTIGQAQVVGVVTGSFRKYY